MRAALGNSAWLLVDRVLRLGFGLVIGAWIARFLGPDQFGLLSFAIAFTGLFAAFASLGLDGIVIRELVKHPSERDLLLGSAMVMKVLAGILTLVLAVVAVSILRPHDARSFALVGIAATGLVFQAGMVIDFYFQSSLQSRFTVISAGAAFAIATVARVALLLSHASVQAFAWAVVAETLLTSCFLVVAYRRAGWHVQTWQFSRTKAAALLRDSWPLILSSISISIALRIDQIMIAQMLGDRDVGLYAAAARVSEVGYFIPGIILTSVFPAIIAIRRQSESFFYERLQTLLSVLVGLAILIALPISLFSGFIIRVLYGAQYAGAASSLGIMVWAGCFVFFGSGWSSWMLLENRTRTMLLFQLNAAVINVALNLVMIPRFGIEGAAFATLISYAAGHTVLAGIIPSQRRALRMLVKSVIPFWLFDRRKPA